MNLIACVDKNWAIGNKGELLVSIPSDKKLFKELTDGKVVIGGRKTMEAIPGGTTLGGRTNIILTSDKKYTYGNAVIVHSSDEALEELKSELVKDTENQEIVNKIVEKEKELDKYLPIQQSYLEEVINLEELKEILKLIEDAKKMLE